MPYRNHNQTVSLQMISVFVVLGVVLIAIPIVCALFVVFSRLKQEKRAEIIKNATTTRTTVKAGANGRTVFESTALKPLSTHAPPSDPVLPFTQQQASSASRSKSVKSAWKRLSRPFSTVPAAYEDDNIELTQKTCPDPYQSSFQERKYPARNAISPITSPVQHRTGTTSSWTTFEGLNQSPISPLSVTNMPASSSVTGAVLTNYQGNHYVTPYRFQGSKDVGQQDINAFPLFPTPSSQQTKEPSKKSKASIAIGSARGFVQTTIREQALTDTNKAKAKQAAKDAMGLAGQYATSTIKNNMLDSKHKFNEVHLSPPPRAKVSGKRF